MNNKKSNTNDIVGIKRIEPRYIYINEDIYDALSKDERNVYMALRYEADYSKETSIVKRSISWLVEKSKVGRRNVFQALNSLEHTHYILQRIQLSVTGIQNNYNVSRTLNFFNPLNTSAPVALVSDTSAPVALPSAPVALGSALNALHISNLSEISINTTTTRAQILNNHAHSEPVVVSSASLTSTPKVNPQKPVNRFGESIVIELRTIYREHPFVTPDGIYGEEDFLSAALFSLDVRGDQSIASRVRGIKKLVGMGTYTGEGDWIIKNMNKRNGAIGDANKELQLKASADKAPILTAAKGQAANMKEIMEKINKNREQTTIKPAYEKPTLIADLPKKTYKPIKKLPEQSITGEYMQPDMELLAEIKAAEEENSVDVWEARL